MNLKNRFLSYSGTVCGGNSNVCDDSDGSSYPPRSTTRWPKMGQIPSTTTFSPNRITSLSGGSNGSNRRRSFRSPFARRKKQKYPLSATFQAPNSNGFEALNINAASVEQFMTLPGVNRRIASSIVDHRFAIGGRFQRVDDLALVSGIGAERLEIIRPEVCIKRMTRSVNGSCTPSRSMVSSRAPSMDSVISEPSVSQLVQQQPLSRTIINVNTSSVFQLQQINGMNQELAAKLVDYRNRKGPFKSLDDLVKVKGLSHARLGAIRSGLCVQDSDIPKTPKFKHASSLSTCPTSTPIRNGYSHNNNNNNTKYHHGVGHRKSISMPIQMNGGAPVSNGFSNVPVNDIFDLLGAYSHRPIVEDNYNNTRNGHSSIRLASWNLDRMCLEKSSNLGVKEVICRTILENRLSIVCVQEIIDPLVLHDLCDELNRPRLRRVAEWKPNNRNWKYAINANCAEGQLNGLGFIYDADRCELMRDDCLDIALDQCVELTNSDLIAPSAYLAAFRLADWTCQVLNTYLRYYDLANVGRIIDIVEQQLRTHQTGLTIHDIFAVAGDFSDTSIEAETPRYLKKRCGSPHAARTSGAIDLQHLGLYGVVEPNSTAFGQQTNTDKSSSATNGVANFGQRTVRSSCNILCRERMPSTRSAFREALYKTKSPLTIYDDLQQNGVDATAAPSIGDRLCGYYGVLRQGLCHMAIPHGFRWGGSVSEHCPVWVELFKCRERSQAPRNPSLDLADNNELATDSIASSSAAVRRKLYQRRSSVNSNVSYHRMNGNTSSGGGGRNYLQNQSMPVPGVLLTNGQLLNASSDSVFLDN